MGFLTEYARVIGCADGGQGRRIELLLGGASCVVVDWVCDESRGFASSSTDDFRYVSNLPLVIASRVVGKDELIVDYLLISICRHIQRCFQRPTLPSEGNRRLRSVNQSGVVLVLSDEVLDTWHGDTLHAL